MHSKYVPRVLELWCHFRRLYSTAPVGSEVDTAPEVSRGGTRKDFESIYILLLLKSTYLMKGTVPISLIYSFASYYHIIPSESLYCTRNIAMLQTMLILSHRLFFKQ